MLIKKLKRLNRSSSAAGNCSNSNGDTKSRAKSLLTSKKHGLCLFRRNIIIIMSSKYFKYLSSVDNRHNDGFEHIESLFFSFSLSFYLCMHFVFSLSSCLFMEKFTYRDFCMFVIEHTGLFREIIQFCIYV